MESLIRRQSERVWEEMDPSLYRHLKMDTLLKRISIVCYTFHFPDIHSQELIGDTGLDLILATREG